MNAVIKMPRKPMNEDDPLVPKQISLALSMKKQLKRASLLSGLSESAIMRNALLEEMRRMKVPSEEDG